jgi:hypothetical protein
MHICSIFVYKPAWQAQLIQQKTVSFQEPQISLTITAAAAAAATTTTAAATTATVAGNAIKWKRRIIH